MYKSENKVFQIIFEFDKSYNKNNGEVNGSKKNKINTSNNDIKNKINVKNGSKDKKKTKKKKGFGKSLLDQGLGMTKQRLCFISQKTGRSFNLVNEKYTTQVCSNCDHFTGPRGLVQLGIREWICFNCGHKHHRDHNSGKNMLRTKEISLLVEKHKNDLNSRSGMVVPVGKE